MIAWLSGKVARIGEDHLILNVSGVGYLVYASRATLSNLPKVGEEYSLDIETQVKEDSITLFGFGNASEKDWFNLITKVQGVGAKVGLAILGVLPPAELGRALASGDKAAVTRAPGVGPKLAQRMISELKDKVAELGAVAGPAPTEGSVPVSDLDTGLTADVVSALTNLGYNQANAAVMVAKLASTNPSADFDELFRNALMEMAG